MTRHFLVKLNSTRTALAPTAFTAIIATEIFLSIVACLCMPFVSEAIFRARVIHRNFRIQVRLISLVFVICISTRFVLLYYQLFDLRFEDNDLLLILTSILRDATFGYLCGMLPSFALERTLATVMWRWYERQTPDTIAALFLIEMINIMPATINSSGWILGYWNFTYNVSFFIFTVILGFILFLSIYFYNRWILRKMSISIVEYSLAKTFQIRENCSIMECLMFACLPAGSITAIGFAFFCYYEWAPEDWLLSRYLAIALFDLFTVLFCLFFMSLAVNMDSEFQKQFNNLPLIFRIRIFLRLKPPIYKKSALKCVHYTQPDIVATTHSYFNQLDSSWLR